MSKADLSKSQLETIFFQCLKNLSSDSQQTGDEIFDQFIDEKPQVLSKEQQPSLLTSESKLTKTLADLSFSNQMYNYIRQNKKTTVSKQEYSKFYTCMGDYLYRKFETLKILLMNNLFDNLQGVDIKIVVLAAQSYVNLMDFRYLKTAWVKIETRYDLSEKLLVLFKKNSVTNKKRIKFLTSGLEFGFSDLSKCIEKCDVALDMILRLDKLTCETELLPLISKNLDSLYQMIPSLKLYCQPFELKQLLNLLDRIDAAKQLTKPLEMLRWEIKENVTSQPIISLEYADIINPLMNLLGDIQALRVTQITSLPSSNIFKSLRKIESKWKTLLTRKKFGNLAYSRNSPLKYLQKIYLLFSQITKEAFNTDLLEIKLYLNLLLIQARILQQLTLAPDQVAALILTPYAKLCTLVSENTWMRRWIYLYNDVIDGLMLFSYLKVDYSTPSLIFKETFALMVSESERMSASYQQSMSIFEVRRITILLAVIMYLPSSWYDLDFFDIFDGMFLCYKEIYQKPEEIDLISLNAHLDILEQAIPFSDFCDKTYSKKFKKIIVAHLNSFGKNIIIVSDCENKKSFFLRKIEELLKLKIRSETIEKALIAFKSVVNCVKSSMAVEKKIIAKLPEAAVAKKNSKVRVKVKTKTKSKNKKKQDIHKSSVSKMPSDSSLAAVAPTLTLSASPVIREIKEKLNKESNESHDSSAPIAEQDLSPVKSDSVSSISTEISRSDEKKVELKSEAQWREFTLYRPTVDSVFPKQIQEFISELYSFCMNREIKPVVCKGGVVRTILLRHYLDYRLEPSDYDFEIEEPKDPVKQSNLIRFLENFMGASSGKRHSLYTLHFPVLKTGITNSVDIDLVQKTFSPTTDFLINSLRLVPECDDQGNILELKIFFNAQYFANELALQQHVVDACLETFGDPKKKFDENCISLLRGARFHIHDGLSLRKIQSAMIEQGYLLDLTRIKNFYKSNKLRSIISNDLRKLTKFGFPQVLNAVELYERLGWLKYFFPEFKLQKDKVIKEVILTVLAAKTPFHLLYELYNIGCWLNITKENKSLIINRSEYFNSHPFNILYLLKLSYEYNLDLPPDFKKIVKNCKLQPLEILISPCAWSLIEDDLNFLLLRGHAFKNFMRLYECGFLSHIFPGAAIQLTTNLSYLKFLQSTLCDIDESEMRDFSPVFHNLLMGELLSSDINEDNFKREVESITDKDTPLIKKVPHADFFRKMDNLQLLEIISSLKTFREIAASRLPSPVPFVTESSFNIFSMPEALPPLVPIVAEEDDLRVDSKGISKITSPTPTSTLGQGQSLSRQTPGIHFQYASHMMPRCHLEQSQNLHVRYESDGQGFSA